MYLYLPLSDDYVNDVVMPDRVSWDISVDRVRPTPNGRQLLNMCKAGSVRILNGRYGRDKGIGEFTIHSTPGSSVVDYIISSLDILNCVVDFHVSDVSQVSDHNTLTCELRINNDINIELSRKRSVTKCIWNPDYTHQYMYPPWKVRRSC